MTGLHGCSPWRSFSRCYLAGTTSMTWRRFTTIILLGKPLSIALYSLGLTVLFQQITGWLG